MNSFEQMEAVIAQRRAEPQEGSYTCYLFEKGIDKILKKVGEECAETIIAAKNGDKAELVGEINDVFYHMMVMMNECGVTMEQGNGHPRPENRQPEEIPRFRPQYLIADSIRQPCAYFVQGLLYCWREYDMMIQILEQR